MKVKALDHVSISTRCLDDTRKFYEDVLGFEVGARPKLASTGYWLYSDGKATIHVVLNEKEAPAAPIKATAEEMQDTGIDNHIAFTVEDGKQVTDRLTELGYGYWDRDLSDRGLYQVFVKDPNGVILELNDYYRERG